MSTDRIQRTLPLFGVLFTVVLVAGLALTSGEPDAGGTRSEIYAYWHTHHGIQLVSNLLLIPFGVVFLLGFTAALRRAIRSGEAGEAVYSPLVLAGGVAASVGLLVTGMLGAATASAAHRNAHDATYTLAQLQSYDWVPWMVGFAVLLLASGVGGLRTRALPKPVAVAGVCLGMLFLTPAGYFALFVFPLWALSTGIVLYRAEQRAARRRLGSAAAAGLALLAVAAVCSSAVASSTTAPGRDGSIAFRRYLDDQQTWGAVFTIAPDGTHARQITHPQRGIVDDQPDWAPDGSAVAFTRCPPNSLCHVWTVNSDGTGVAPVGPVCPAGADEQSCSDDATPSFTSDSKQLVFVQATGAVRQAPVTGAQIEHAAIAFMNRDGSERRVVYTTKAFAADLEAPMVSPDGKQIVFELRNSGYSKPAGKRAVFVIGVDGSNLRRLTPWSDNAGDNPDWSPDGEWILFHSHVGDGGGIQDQYFRIHPDGGGRRQLSHFPSGTFVGSASFSPDGRSIVFSKGPAGGNVDVYTMGFDGSHVRRVTRSKLWDSAPDWGSSRAAKLSTSPLRATFAAHSQPFPQGRFTSPLTAADFLRYGGRMDPSFPHPWVITIRKGRWHTNESPTFGGTYVLAGNAITFVVKYPRDAVGGREKLTWTYSDGRLRFKVVSGVEGGDKAIYLAHPWRRLRP